MLLLHKFSSNMQKVVLPDALMQMPPFTVSYVELFPDAKEKRDIKLLHQFFAECMLVQCSF